MNLQDTQLAQLAVTALLGLAISVAGWYYARKKGLAQIEQRLQDLTAAEVATLNARVNTLERLRQQENEDCARRIAALEERFNRWAGGPIG